MGKNEYPNPLKSNEARDFSDTPLLFRGESSVSLSKPNTFVLEKTTDYALP
jgi:hypothetical protein